MPKKGYKRTKESIRKAIETRKKTGNIPPLLNPSEIFGENGKSNSGYVYFALKLGYVKIGCTRINPADRIKILMSSHPLDVEAELLYFIPAKNRYKREREFHKYFSNKRVRGEWFALTEEDIRIIKDGEV